MKTKLFTLIALFCVLALSSCKKEPLPTTYSVTFQASLSGYVTARVFECNEMSEKLYANSIEYVRSQKKYSFTVSSDMISKIKIHYTIKDSPSDGHNWIQQVFILNKEGNTDIALDYMTIVGKLEP